MTYQYYISIWQETVAPEDPAAVALSVQERMNALADEGWDIFQISTAALSNNIFRVVLFCRKAATTGRPLEAEPDETSTEIDEAEADEAPHRSKPGAHHPAARKRHR